MRQSPVQQVYVSTVVIQRPPGSAPLDPEALTRGLLAGVYRQTAVSRTRQRLYMGLSMACLAGAMWAVWMAVKLR